MPTPVPDAILALARSDVGRRVAEGIRGGETFPQSFWGGELGLSERQWRTLRREALAAWPVSGGAKTEPTRNGQRTNNRTQRDFGLPKPPPQESSSPAPWLDKNSGTSAEVTTVPNSGPALAVPAAMFPSRGLKIACVGDVHVKPDHDDSRAELLAWWLLEHLPDALVFMGDVGDMPSLSSYDRNKRSFEGRRYIRDIEAVIAFRQKVMRILRRVDPAFAARLKKYVLGGNHDEARIERATQDAAEFDGLISFADFRWEEDGFEVVPFLEHLELGGVYFSHYVPSKGNSKKAISGDYAAQHLINKRHGAYVVGHSHRLQFARALGPGKRPLHSMSVGCFFDEHESYAGDDNFEWWRGLVMLHDVVDGSYDVETWSMERLKRRYGKAA